MLRKYTTAKDKIRDAVITRDNRTCQYCGKKNLYKRSLHLDHIIPESKGGRFVEDNLIVACAACNIRRGNKPQVKYIEDRLRQIELEMQCLEKLKSSL